MILRRRPALAGLALRVGLGLVLFGWGFDGLLHPLFYAHILGGAAPMLMGLLLVLAPLLVAGVAIRPVTAVTAAVLLGLLVVGRQPIGLPQNVGLVAAAIALAILGPGHLALRGGSSSVSLERLRQASFVLRAGLAYTFLAYAVQTFTSLDEYQIVVRELPLGTLALQALGTTPTVALVGALELLLGLILILPRLSTLGAAAQSVGLLTFVATVGYPFSYPQDLGLLAAEVALVLVTGLNVRARLAAPRVRSVSVSRLVTDGAPVRAA